MLESIPIKLNLLLYGACLFSTCRGVRVWLMVALRWWFYKKYYQPFGHILNSGTLLSEGKCELYNLELCHPQMNISLSLPSTPSLAFWRKVCIYHSLEMLPPLRLSKYRGTTRPNAFICSSNVFPMPCTRITQGNPLSCFSSKVGGKSLCLWCFNSLFSLILIFV